MRSRRSTRSSGSWSHSNRSPDGVDCRSRRSPRQSGEHAACDASWPATHERPVALRPTVHGANTGYTRRTAAQCPSWPGPPDHLLYPAADGERKQRERNRGSLTQLLGGPGDLTLAESESFLSLCSVSRLERGVEPVRADHWWGNTVQNSCSDNRSDSRAPSSKAQISLWTFRACTSLPADPPPHFAPLPTCGPKKMASRGPGELPPRQFSFEPPIHGFVDFGALECDKGNREGEREIWISLGRKQCRQEHR